MLAVAAIARLHGLPTDLTRLVQESASTALERSPASSRNRVSSSVAFLVAASSAAAAIDLLDPGVDTAESIMPHAPYSNESAEADVHGT